MALVTGGVDLTRVVTECEYDLLSAGGLTGNVVVLSQILTFSQVLHGVGTELVMVMTDVVQLVDEVIGGIGGGGVG